MVYPEIADTHAYNDPTMYIFISNQNLEHIRGWNEKFSELDKIR